jgi:hypothetical protein
VVTEACPFPVGWGSSGTTACSAPPSNRSTVLPGEAVGVPDSERACGFPGEDCSVTATASAIRDDQWMCAPPLTS